MPCSPCLARKHKFTSVAALECDSRSKQAAAPNWKQTLLLVCRLRSGFVLDDLPLSIRMYFIAKKAV